MVALQSDLLTPSGLRSGYGGGDILGRILYITYSTGCRGHSLAEMSAGNFTSQVLCLNIVLQTALRSYKKHNFGQCYATTEAEEQRWQ